MKNTLHAQTLETTFSRMADVVSSFKKPDSHNMPSHAFDGKALEFAQAAEAAYLINPDLCVQRLERIPQQKSISPGFIHVAQNVLLALQTPAL